MEGTVNISAQYVAPMLQHDDNLSHLFTFNPHLIFINLIILILNARKNKTRIAILRFRKQGPGEESTEVHRWLQMQPSQVCGVRSRFVAF